MERPFTLLLAFAAACASTVPLDRSGEDLLRSAPSVAVAWVPSGEAQVECPADEGMKTWEYPSSRREAPGGAAAGVRLAVLTEPSGLPVRYAVSGTWEAIVGQWTEGIRVPPVDPAMATARAFLRRERSRAGGASWSGPPVELRDASARTALPAGSLLLVVEARRFVLLGCYFRFRPWFDARATLLDPTSGRVLWRQRCGDDVGPAGSQESWPSELAADGGALYAQLLEARAEACAGHLAGALRQGVSGGAPAR